MNLYTETSTKLSQHILDLIPNNPSILKMDSPWTLFKLKDFTAYGNPSLFQASWALGWAQQKYKAAL